MSVSSSSSLSSSSITSSTCPPSPYSSPKPEGKFRVTSMLSPIRDMKTFLSNFTSERNAALYREIMQSSALSSPSASSSSSFSSGASSACFAPSAAALSSAQFPVIGDLNVQSPATQAPASSALSSPSSSSSSSSASSEVSLVSSTPAPASILLQPTPIAPVSSSSQESLSASSKAAKENKEASLKPETSNVEKTQEKRQCFTYSCARSCAERTYEVIKEGVNFFGESNCMSATSLLVGYCALGPLGCCVGMGAILVSQWWYFSSPSLKPTDKDTKAQSPSTSLMPQSEISDHKKEQVVSTQTSLAKDDEVSESVSSTDSVNSNMSAEEEWKLKAQDIKGYLAYVTTDFLNDEGIRKYVVGDLLENFKVDVEKFKELWSEDSTFESRKEGFLKLLLLSVSDFRYDFCKEVFESEIHEDQEKKIERRRSF